MSPRANTPRRPGRTARAGERRMPPVEVLLAIAVFVSALVLGLSELLTPFELTPPGGEPLQVVEAGDRHSYALFVLAVFAVVALGITVMSGSKPAAFAVAAAGAIALLIFLLGDLPDAGKIGTLDDPSQSFIDAEAVPKAGFWLELLGALSLAVAGAALATLTPEQLAMGERWRERREKRRAAEEKAATNGGEEPKPSPKRRRGSKEEREGRPERVKDRVERVRRAASRRRGAD